jgi:hypothetical protein
MFLVSALIPLIVGAIYYNPKVVGAAWMKTNGFKSEDLEGANMAVIFGATYFFSILISFILASFVIHQGSVMSMMFPEVLETGSAAQNEFNELMTRYGDANRGFKHGMAHGLMVSIFFVLPIIAIISLFERRGWKYIFIHFVYWLISLVLMGGLLCQTLVYAPL